MRSRSESFQFGEDGIFGKNGHYPAPKNDNGRRTIVFLECGPSSSVEKNCSSWILEGEVLLRREKEDLE